MSESDGAQQVSRDGSVPAGGGGQAAVSLPTQFHVEVDTVGSEAWVRVEGELDIYTTPGLLKAIDGALETEPERLMVTMTQVSFMDSSAISALVRSQQSADLRGSKLVVHAPSRGVRRTLDLAGLGGYLLMEG